IVAAGLTSFVGQRYAKQRPEKHIRLTRISSSLMRLSLGQQMQLAQKQVLAPRMIQSMEILQLPLMALQERIEQEMENNEMLEQVEVDENEPEAEAQDSE